MATLYPDSPESPWSEVRSFSVAIPIVALDSPGNGQSVNTLQPMLTWTTASDATSYRAVVGRDMGLSAPTVDAGGLTSPSLAVPQTLANFATYYWKVAVVDANGVNGQWSETRSFAPSGTYDVPRRTIQMNGDRGEWAGIEPAAVDPVGDSTTGEAGSDVTELYICADDSFLYLRFELADRTPTIANYYLAVLANVQGGSSDTTYSVHAMESGGTWQGVINTYVAGVVSSGSYSPTNCSVTDFVEVKAPWGQLPGFVSATIGASANRSGAALDSFGNFRAALSPTDLP